MRDFPLIAVAFCDKDVFDQETFRSVIGEIRTSFNRGHQVDSVGSFEEFPENVEDNQLNGQGTPPIA